MFSYISGILEDKGNDCLVVDVNGIGYKINTSFTSICNVNDIGKKVKLFTHLYVREDIMTLYGFSTKEELRVFEMLIAVSGIGPKAALSVLSEVTPTKFSMAVITEDIKTITKAQGIGKKIAQRIILELKDKLKKENISNIDNVFDNNTNNEDSVLNEAANALMVLGYTNFEANNAVAKVYKENIQLEELVKRSLNQLSSSKV